MAQADKDSFTLVVPENFEQILKKLKKKDRVMFQKLLGQVKKILNRPTAGKPLRNVLRNYRRVHIDPFVLVYEIHGSEVRLLDFDHHDKIYKKFSP